MTTDPLKVLSAARAYARAADQDACSADKAEQASLAAFHAAVGAVAKATARANLAVARAHARATAHDLAQALREVDAAIAQVMADPHANGPGIIRTVAPTEPG